MLPSFLMLLLLAGPAATQAAEAQNAPRSMEGCQQRYLAGLSGVNRGIANICMYGVSTCHQFSYIGTPKNPNGPTLSKTAYTCAYLYLYACMHVRGGGARERESDTAYCVGIKV